MAFHLCGVLMFEMVRCNLKFSSLDVELLLKLISINMLQNTNVPVSCLLLKLHSAIDRLTSLIWGSLVKIDGLGYLIILSSQLDATVFNSRQVKPLC